MKDAKPTWIENRKLAVLVLVFAIIISIFGIGTAKVGSIGRKVQTQFSSVLSGERTARIAAAEGIVAASEAVAGDTAAYKEADAAVQAIKAAKGAKAQYEANVILNNKVETLYQNVHLINGEPAMGSGLQMQYSEFSSRNNRLDRAKGDYNTVAFAAQKKLRGFPANMLAALVGAKAEPFGA